MKQVFKARLIGRGPAGAWTFLPVPFSVEEKFGSKARVPVTGKINGFAFRNSLMPEGDGTHTMMVSKALREGAGASKGGLVSVEIDIDNAPRKVVVPPELKAALRGSAPAKEFFEQLSYSCQREYADWIAGAKRPETKAARVSKAIGRLREKRKWS
jgi:hypothetical protein